MRQAKSRLNLVGLAEPFVPGNQYPAPLSVGTARYRVYVKPDGAFKGVPKVQLNRDVVALVGAVHRRQPGTSDKQGLQPGEPCDDVRVCGDAFQL